MPITPKQILETKKNAIEALLEVAIRVIDRNLQADFDFYNQTVDIPLQDYISMELGKDIVLPPKFDQVLKQYYPDWIITLEEDEAAQETRFIFEPKESL